MVGEASASPLADEQKLDLSFRIAAGLAGVAGVDAAFVSGSLLDGLGTATSDIDVYRVGDELAGDRQQLGAGHIRIDVQDIAMSRLCLAVHAMVSAPTGDRTAPSVSAADLELAIRFRQARITHDDGRLASLQQLMVDNDAAVRQQLLRHWLTTAHLWCEDQAGFLQSHDDDAALSAGRHVLMAAGKAVAVACCDYYVGQKWVWRQLARSAPEGFPLARFRQLLRADLLGDGDGPGLSDLAQLAQTILLAAATIGWHHGIVGPWPGWQTGSGQLIRQACWMPRASAGCVIASLPARRRVRMRHETALAWALCDGLDEDEVIERASVIRVQSPAYENVTADSCRKAVNGLLDLGILARRQVHG